jgi:hypothetical protein
MSRGPGLRKGGLEDEGKLRQFLIEGTYYRAARIVAKVGEPVSLPR